MTHPIARYVPLLIEGDLAGLLALFQGVPRVNGPQLGWVEASRFAQFVAASHDGLAERSAHVGHLTTTTTRTGAVEACLLTLVRRGTTVVLPVALAAETSSDALLESLRIELRLPADLVRSSPARPPAALEFHVGGALCRIRSAASTTTTSRCRTSRGREPRCCSRSRARE